MQISQKGIDLIKSFEGCELHSYQDAVGVWTVGYGSTRGVHKGQSLTQAQAEALLKSDLKSFVQGVNSLVKVSINTNQFDALVAFAFNLGIGALKSSDLLTFVNKGNFASASKEFEKWVHAGGKVLPGLVRRRKAERALFMTPAKTASKPASKTVTKPAVKKATSTATFEVVQKGETLWEFANKHHTTVEAVQKLNHGIKAENLQIGQRVRIK